MACASNTYVSEANLWARFGEEGRGVLCKVTYVTSQTIIIAHFTKNETYLPKKRRVLCIPLNKKWSLRVQGREGERGGGFLEEAGAVLRFQEESPV